MARQIVVDIVGDASKFDKTMDATATKSQGWGTKMAGAMKFAAVGVAAVGTVAGVVGFQVLEMGNQFEAMDAKARTVFGGSLGQVEKWAAANAQAMGLTRREATGLAANMGDLLIPMGFTRDQAAGMATDIVGLSGALSEWSGGTRTSAEVSEILQKALLGEREGLKALGISISDADVKAQLLRDGTAGLTGAQLEQAKASATQTLLFAKSTDAQAAYEAGTAKGIRTQNEMKAKLNEVKETLVTALMPILVKVGTFLADNLPNAIRIAGEVFAWLSQNVFPQVAAGARVIIDTIAALVPVFSTTFAVIGNVVRTAGAAFSGLATVVANVWHGITATIRASMNAVIGIVNAAIRGINAIQVHIAVGPVKYDFWGLKLASIPYLHAGGIVPGAPGSNVLAMLQAGERVIPNGGGGASTVVVQLVVDGRILAEVVNRENYYRRAPASAVMPS